MAELKFSCPQCKQSLEGDDSFRGQTVTCPSCNAQFTVPNAPVKRVVVQSPPVAVPTNKAADESFCASCGQVIKKEAEICPKCGVRQKSAASATGEGKNWLTTLLLCLFLGGLGVHRFYTGHTGIGVVQLLTFGGCGIWALVDFIMIIAGSYKDAKGNPLVKS